MHISRAICKITYGDNKGTGFLIKINKKAVEALPKKLLRDEEFMKAVNKVK